MMPLKAMLLSTETACGWLCWRMHQSAIVCWSLLPCPMPSVKFNCTSSHRPADPARPPTRPPGPRAEGQPRAAQASVRGAAA